MYACEQMCETKKKSSNIVVSSLVSLVKEQVSLLFSLGISATPLNNKMSEARLKVDSIQLFMVTGVVVGDTRWRAEMLTS